MTQEARWHLPRLGNSSSARAVRITFLALLPVVLCLVIAERASWRPRILPGARPNVFQVAFSPNGKYLAVAAQSTTAPSRDLDGHTWTNRKFDDALDVWDAQGYTLLHQIRLSEQSLGSIAFSPDGSELAGLVSWPTIDNGGSRHHNAVKIWSTETGKLQRTLRVGGAYSQYLIWPTVSVLMFVDAQNGIRQWDAYTGKLLHTVQDDGWQSGLSPDGQTVVRRDDNQGWQLWRARSRTQRRVMDEDFSTDVSLLTFSSDSALVAACVQDPSSSVSAIKVWDTRSGRLKRRLHNLHVPGSLAISPEKNLMATGDDDNAVRLWNIQRGTLIRTMRTSPAASGALAFSPDGMTLAVGSRDGTFTLWRVQ